MKTMEIDQRLREHIKADCARFRELTGAAITFGPDVEARNGEKVSISNAQVVIGLTPVWNRLYPHDPLTSNVDSGFFEFRIKPSAPLEAIDHYREVSSLIRRDLNRAGGIWSIGPGHWHYRIDNAFWDFEGRPETEAILHCMLSMPALFLKARVVEVCNAYYMGPQKFSIGGQLEARAAIRKSPITNEVRAMSRWPEQNVSLILKGILLHYDPDMASLQNGRPALPRGFDFRLGKMGYGRLLDITRANALMPALYGPDLADALVGRAADDHVKFLSGKEGLRTYCSASYDLSSP